MENTFSVFINDRSDIHRKCCSIPPNHEKNPTDEWVHRSWLENFDWHMERYGCFFSRRDIVLINAPDGNQYDVSLTRDGQLDWQGLEILLTKDQVEEAEAIALRCVALAEDYPSAMRVGLGIDPEAIA